MALKDDDGYLYERLHRWSPLGHIEVVAKVFSDLKKEPVVALCDGDAIVKTCIDLEDAKEERKRLQRKTDIKTIHKVACRGLPFPHHPRIPKDSWEFPRIPTDSQGVLGIPRDSCGFL